VTLVQMQPRPASADPGHKTVAEVMDAAGPQVCDDMSVEVALSVMAAACTGRLVVCDQDGRCTGLVTRTERTAVRDSSDCTDHVRLREILGDHWSFTTSVATTAEAEHAMCSLRLGAPQVVDGQGGAPGVLALSR